MNILFTILLFEYTFTQIYTRKTNDKNEPLKQEYTAIPSYVYLVSIVTKLIHLLVKYTLLFRIVCLQSTYIYFWFTNFLSFLYLHNLRNYQNHAKSVRRLAAYYYLNRVFFENCSHFHAKCS